MKYYMFNGLEKGKKQNGIKKEINKRKVCKLVIILFIVILLISIATLYTTNEKCREILDKYIFRKEVYENNLPTIQVDSSKNVNIYAYDKYITILDQNKLKLYNKAGNEEHSLDIEVSSPIFEANGDYLAIAEKNGQKVYLIYNKNIVWQKDIEGNNIFCNGKAEVLGMGKLSIPYYINHYGNFVEDAYEYDNISDHNLGTGYYPYGDLPSSSDAYEGDNSNRWNTD